MKLRDYQIELADKCLSILKEHHLVYLAAEVRCGKTATSLEIAKLYGCKRLLFLTKVKAIKSIQKDYEQFGFSEHFDVTVINDESIHKVEGDFDMVVHDEHHRFASFPKPSKGARLFKDKYGNLPMIFLSGTPYPESKSQIFHQFWVSKCNPFKINNFYGWFKQWGLIKKEFDLGFGNVSNYHSTKEVIYKYWSVKKRAVAKDDPEYDLKMCNIKKWQESDILRQEESENKLLNFISKYIVTFSQKEAGFETEVSENVHYVKMKPITYKLANKLKKDRVITGKENVILADTAVKLMGKLLQLFSGTILFEEGNAQTIDSSKVDYIADKFKGKRLGIFYKFKQEYIMLKDYFGESLTNDITEFDNGIKNIALQYIAGREGISLKNADELIFLTPDFSAVTYLQARDRMSTLDRKDNNLHWILSDTGIDKRVYNVVRNKKSYTTSVFNKDTKEY